MKRLGETVSKRAGLPFTGGSYHNVESAGLETIRREKPPWGIVSLGFYLKPPKDLKLRVLATSEPPEPFRVLVHKDSTATLRDLQGKTITGPALVEPEFVRSILFEGRPRRGSRTR